MSKLLNINETINKINDFKKFELKRRVKTIDTITLGTLGLADHTGDLYKTIRVQLFSKFLKYSKDVKDLRYVVNDYQIFIFNDSMQFIFNLEEPWKA